jgi:hypothetical protein
MVARRFSKRFLLTESSLSEIQDDMPKGEGRSRFSILRRRWVWIPLAVFSASCLLGLWLPYRVAVVQAFFWLGGSRVQVPAEYRALDAPELIPVATMSGYPSKSDLLVLQDGESAQAIPLSRLAWHMVLNDHVGDRPLVVTLCGITEAALAYQASCRGQTLTFQPARVARNNLVIRDRETKSDWQQFTGQAIAGPLSGCQLERVAMHRLPMEQFAQRFPQGKILKPTGDDRDTSTPNQSCPVMSHFANEPFLLQTPSRQDLRLPRKQRILGWFDSAGHAHARRVDCPSTDVDPTRRVDTFWFAWSEFFPDTLLDRSCTLGPLGVLER